jgi:hypothetical protein
MVLIVIGEFSVSEIGKLLLQGRLISMWLPVARCSLWRKCSYLYDLARFYLGYIKYFLLRWNREIPWLFRFRISTLTGLIAVNDRARITSLNDDH